MSFNTRKYLPSIIIIIADIKNRNVSKNLI